MQCPLPASCLHVVTRCYCVVNVCMSPCKQLLQIHARCLSNDASTFSPRLIVGSFYCSSCYCLLLPMKMLSANCRQILCSTFLCMSIVLSSLFIHSRCLPSSDMICCHMPSYVYSLSLSFPVGGAGHRPNPFQVAPEASWVGSEGVSWPGVPPGMIVGRTLEHQMLGRLVGSVAVWADGRVPARDPVKVSCYQWGMTHAYLCHCDALVPGPIPLPTLVTVLAACKDSVDPGMCTCPPHRATLILTLTF